VQHLHIGQAQARFFRRLRIKEDRGGDKFPDFKNNAVNWSDGYRNRCRIPPSIPALGDVCFALMKRNPPQACRVRGGLVGSRRDWGMERASLAPHTACEGKLELFWVDCPRLWPIAYVMH
jgi:hypothetical protein